MATMSNRDPYPFPKFQNDWDFTYCSCRHDVGIIKTLKRKHEVVPKGEAFTIYKDGHEVYGTPTYLAQQHDPWRRLNTKHTLSSSRHEVYHVDKLVPKDGLDFILKSKFNQDDLFRTKNQTLFQKETFDEDHGGRKLTNREKKEEKQVPILNHPLRISEQLKRESPHSVKNAIAWAHHEQTNPGYSRKNDGGMFVF